MKNYLCVLVYILFFGVTMKALATEVTSKEQKTFKLGRGGYISVIGDEGYINVESWDRNEVELVMNKHAWGRSKRDAEELLKKIQVETNQTGSRLDIRQVNLYSKHQFSIWDVFDPDKWDNHRWDYAVDFDLKVPKEVELRLQADEGDISVSDIIGDLEVDVDEGKIYIKNVQFNNAGFNVDEGDIECYNMTSENGRLNIEADEGDIRLEKCHVQKLKIKCDEGDIFLRNSRLKSLDVSGDESNIRADFIPENDGKYYIYTDEGDITIFLPGDCDAEFRLETSEGRIDTDFDLKVTELDDGERVRGRIGKGDSKIEVYTDEGDISIQEK